MGANLERYIERFHFTPERREMFLNNIELVAQNTSEGSDPFPFHPAYFWDDDDLNRMDQADKEKLFSWLYEEALTASKTATEDYDYSVAPTTLEELEEEVQMIQYAGAIYRVLELQGRYHLSVVLTDEQGRPFKRYSDGRIEYIRR